MKDEFWLPEPEVVCRQSRDNKQGRETEAVAPAEAQAVIDSLAAGQKEAYAAYRQLVDSGIARELARVNLPLSLYTEWYWQMDLHNLFRFIILRTDAHAQREIRDYANLLLDLARAVAPLACRSLERHFLGGCRFSAEELAAVRAMLAGAAPQLEGKQMQELQAKLAEPAAGN
jgi:thymidylate synthase (FAD)